MATSLPPKRPVWPVAALVALLVLVFLGIWQRERVIGWFGSEPEAEPAPERTAEVEPPPAEEPEEGPAEARWREVTGGEPRFATEPGDCEVAAAELEQLCARLDARAEAEGLSVGAGACARLDAAMVTLAAARPVLAGEARDPATLLANATHLFRVGGRGEVAHAAALLRLEADAIEPMAATLFRWLECRPENEALLYDYAVFGFTTLGGQAYLRRRSPRVEALAAFYGLLVIDRADRDGRNAAGVDPRREIARVRELIAGQPLHFRDRYLDELDAMESRWSER